MKTIMLETLEKLAQSWRESGDLLDPHLRARSRKHINRIAEGFISVSCEHSQKEEEKYFRIYDEMKRGVYR